MAANKYNIQDNPGLSFVIVAARTRTTADLIYTAGGGTIFSNEIKDDAVDGGGQLHVGNPVLEGEDVPVYKKCGKVDVVNETITVQSGDITRGLFIYRQTDPSNPNSKLSGSYYWDEIYTTPVGFFTIIASDSNTFELSLLGNVMKIRTNDVNIVPKEGDYIIMQKLPLSYVPPADTIDPINTSFTDGYSNMPVVFNTETYQLKINNVTFSTPSGKDTEYTLTLDKSLSVQTAERYAVVLLNRENTGLQKELFYDTFEQIEIHRDQLLGDPYYNTSLVKPQGRKNYLYYNNGQYLGLRNLLLNIINAKNQAFIETPFLVFDISDEIKDRFYNVPSDENTSNFEFHLPTIMLQEDTSNNLNVLTNYGTVQNEIDGVGAYSGLYLKWDTSLGKRFGFVFYDLRIVVIDDAELALALGYNSNRNYTLPKSTFNSSGNSLANVTSNVSLDVVGLDNGGGNVVVIVNGAHGLDTGTAVTIEDVFAKVPGSNIIQPASANGVKYIKRFYSDPVNNLGERIDRFYIYEDSSLTTATQGNGTFVNNGTGQSGKVRGASLAFEYFYTYRIKNERYSSILPQGEISSFNFANSTFDSVVNNSSGSLFIRIPQFTYLDNGFECNDLEIIIGKWDATNPTKPYEITGIKDVVVISVQETPTPTLPNTTAYLDIVLPVTLYNSFVTKMGNGQGAYDFATNPNGDPTYDIYDNYKHYNITSGVFEETLNTAKGKWTIGNVKYKNSAEQYRSKIQIVVGAAEWNDTTNPSYDPDNTFLTEKYISEVAITNSSSDQPLIYAKVSPPIKKTPDLDLILSMYIDW